MKKILIAVSVVFLFSCQDDKNTMTVNGNIEGLKKGTIYFQKVENDSLVTIDSVTAEGSGKFVFEKEIESPEVFYISLDKNDGNQLNDRLPFFGTPGIINIDSQVDLFDINAKIEGSQAQKELDEYNKMMRRFNDQNLDILQAQIQAVKDGKAKESDSLKRVGEKNNLRKYLFTINYALNHKNSYVTPYITLRDAYNAKAKYLDSIYNSLSSDVANSKYGKQLKEYITELKDTITE